MAVVSLSNNDGDGNESGKKAIGSAKPYHAVLYIRLLPLLHEYDDETILVSHFIEDVNTRQQFSFSFSELRDSFSESTPVKAPNN